MGAPDGEGMLSEPFWIRGRCPLAAWYHLPEDSTVRATVVTCGPVLGEDATKARIAFVGLAEALAEVGIGLLRFDYPGLGNSGESPQGSRQVDLWKDGITRAVDFACSASEAPVVVVGMRLGATLAWEAARCDGRVGAFVLWDPVFDGRRYLRAQQAFVASVFKVKQPPGGWFVGPGYVLDEDAADSLNSLVLETGGLQDSTLKPPVLVAAQSGERTAQQRIAPFVEAGCETMELEGQEAIMQMPPHEVRLDRGDLDKLSAWISNRVPSARFKVEDRPAGAGVVHHASGQPVQERFLLIGSTPLFAVQTEPVVAVPSTPTVVFLSAGALENFGPGRLWAETSRELASLGFRSVRVDSSGVGDTPPRSNARRGEMLHPDALSDLEEIAEALGAPDGRGLVFIGLSSGAYHAAEAGLRMKPEGVCIINGSVTAKPAELRSSAEIDPRRKAYRPMPSAFERFARTHKRTSQVLWKVVGNVAPARAAQSVPGQIAARGTRVLWIATNGDRSAFTGNVYWRMRELFLSRRGLYARYRFRFDDHPLYTPDARRLIKRIVVDFAVDARDSSRTAPQSS